VSALLMFFGASSMGQERILPPEQVPDEIAYTVVFHVIRTGQPPRWDYETRRKWLMDRGLSHYAAQTMIRTADRYFKIHEEIEAELASWNSKVQNSLSSQAADERSRIEAKRTVALQEAIESIRNELPGPEVSDNIRSLIAQIKQGVKVRAR
jgi:hypothetical protein